MPSSSSFSLELLQAINDWQIGGSPKQKATKAEKLNKCARRLPSRFRKCKKPCYRQLSLLPGHIFELNDTLTLPETTSSWTASLDIAQQFKGGVPPEGYQGIIFEVLPPKDTVVINLDRLYNNKGFMRAVEENKDNIIRFGDGIGRYRNSQREIVISLKEVGLHEVASLGGYSDSRVDVAKLYFQKDVISFAELLEFDKLSTKANVKTGPAWIIGAPKDRCIARIQEKAPYYRLRKQLEQAFNDPQSVEDK